MKIMKTSIVAALLLGGLPLIEAFQAPSCIASSKRLTRANSPSSTIGIAKINSRHPYTDRRRHIASKNLAAATTTGNDNDDPYASPRVDTDALTKYSLAAITQLALFSATFQLIDLASAQLGIVGPPLPFPALAFLFYACSLKSRVFNPLNNQRPDRSKAVDGEGSAGFRDRVMPSWTPPGVLFPIMWLLIIGPIRAYSSALVVSATGSLFTLPTMAFIAHLTVGDIWNTINNTEKRYGAAVIGVVCVVLSAVNAAFQYSTVDAFAGKLLGGTCVWLVTAAALITDTWRLNPTESGKRVPLYPVKGEAETSFQWGSKAADN
jgi:benzodiazapine receptor